MYYFLVVLEFRIFALTFIRDESESLSIMSDSLRPHGQYRLLYSAGQNTGVGSLPLLQQVFLTQESNRGLLHRRWILYQLSYQKGKSEVPQLCPTLCDSMDCSIRGPSAHGIFQARVLKWVAISFSRGSF